MRSASLGACVILVVASVLGAQPVVVPNANAGTSGTVGVNTLVRDSGNPRTYQAQISATELAALRIGDLITGIAYRFDQTGTNPSPWPPAGGATWANYDITLSRAANALGSFSSTFASNELNPILVRSGPLTIPAGAFPSGTNPNAFGFTIPIQPYTYAGGDLVITIRHTGSNLVGAPFLDAVAISPTGHGIAQSATAYAATTGFPTSFTILRFTVIPREFEPNQPEADIDHDGLETNGSFPATVQKCQGQMINFNMASTLAGFPSDVAITLGSLVPRSAPGSAVLSDGQVFNVPLADPSLLFLWSASPVPAMLPFFPVNINFPAPAGPISWCGQLVVINPASPSFLSLSQGAGVQVTAVNAAPGPIGDDQTLSYTISAPPLCGPASVPFFGTSYTRISVASNGRVFLGTSGNLDFTATLAEVVTGAPFVGLWTDLNPTAGGNILVTSGPGFVEAQWAGVRYFNTTVPNSFAIRFSTGGNVGISGLGTVLPTTSFGSGAAQFLGISNGASSASLLVSPFPFNVPLAGGANVAMGDFWDGAAVTAPGGVRLVQTIQTNQAMAGMGRLDFIPSGLGYSALNH